MDKSSTSIGLTIGRVGAVVVAVAALAYFVIIAQQQAQSSQDGGASAPAGQPDPSSIEAPDPIEAKKTPEVFLPSSKSMPLPSDWAPPSGTSKGKQTPRVPPASTGD